MPCDRFGNFIGEAGESDEESIQDDQPGAEAYVDFQDEAEEVTGQELMEIDGGSRKQLSTVEHWLM